MEAEIPFEEIWVGLIQAPCGEWLTIGTPFEDGVSLEKRQQVFATAVFYARSHHMEECAICCRMDHAREN